MIKKLINRSITQLSTRLNYQLNYNFESLGKKKASDYSREYQVSRTYFNNKLDDLQTNCKNIISSILQNPKEVSKNQQLLSSYLDVHGSVNKVKSARGLLMLLIAVNMSKQPALSSFTKSIFEHLVRNKVDQQVMDSVMLRSFMQLTRFILNTPLQKAKHQSLLYTYIKIAKKNLQLLDLIEYFQLIEILTYEKKNRLYFSKFALKLQQFLVQNYYLIYMEDRADSKIQCYMRHTYNVLNMLKLMNHFNCTKQNGELMYNFIDRFYLKGKIAKGFMNFDLITRLYRYYPYLTKDSDGIFHKTKVRNQIIAYLQTKNINQLTTNKKAICIFCNTIIHQIIYQNWMNLNFSQVDGNVFLEKNELKQPPILPDYFWKLYLENSEDINSVQIIGDLLKTMYPKKFIKNKYKTKNEVLQPFSETEMKIRMQIVLMNLKIEYKKEVNIQGRYIDFLLEDTIVLELDGLLHFDPYEFKMDQKTTCRNTHLLFAGYKILLINIQEYNLNRQVPQLTKLFQWKLAILKQYDCLAVL